MRIRIACSALALLALTQLAAAQGTSGGTGAVASIPGSVVRAGQDKTPLAQPGLISILTNGVQPDVDANSRQKTRRGESPALPK